MIAPPDSPAALSVRDGLAAISRAEIDAYGWIAALLERANVNDGRVRAWTQPVEERRRRLANVTIADRRFPLAGLPIGVKDVIDAQGWPTECNSPIEKGRVATASATAVERLQAAGGIVIGKTVTTEYAFLAPGPTTNPHDAARTPGGSSSGSAAAVADFQVPVALTTQTGGSTIRPAAFCGIVGYKPPFGTVPMRGVSLLAPSIDVVGLYARSVADIALVASVMEATPRLAERGPIPRFVVLEMPPSAQVDACVHAMVAATVPYLAGAGACVRRIAIPPSLAELDAAHRVIMCVEVARSLEEQYARRRSDLSVSLAAFIERGRNIQGEEIAAAQAALARARVDLRALALGEEILVMPAAPGEATLGLESTGNAMLNRLWSLLHVGVMSLPAGTGPAGLPLGLQLIDPVPHAPNLFAAAAFAEAALLHHLR